MSMESPEEAIATIVKGKRTKRQRFLQLAAAAVTTTAATTSSSTSSSAEFSGSTTEEEEDMANCLILLAQGKSPRSTDVYECKTCNKCFPSFQALGGHRASHKRPKTSPSSVAEPTATTEEKKGKEIEEIPQISLVTAINTSSCNKSRVHECSICGSEFSSGQALGGHMRRHRPPAPAVVVVEIEERKKGKNVLPLDLNLPAPSEDDCGDFLRSPSFASFAGKQPAIVFSSPALVDCHY